MLLLIFKLVSYVLPTEQRWQLPGARLEQAWEVHCVFVQQGWWVSKLSGVKHCCALNHVYSRLQPQAQVMCEHTERRHVMKAETVGHRESDVNYLCKSWTYLHADLLIT